MLKERNAALLGVMEGGDLAMKNPPRTALQLAASTSRGLQPKVLHANLIGPNWPERLAALQPVVTGINVGTWGEFVSLCMTVAEIKKNAPTSLVVVGGVYPSAYWKETLEIPGVDILGVGWGDLGWQEITQCIAKEHKVATLSGFQGLYMASEAHPDRVLPLKPVPLARLAQPDYRANLVTLEEYVPPGDNLSTNDMIMYRFGPNVLSALGCDKDCAFCIQTLIHKNDNFGRSHVEQRPPKQVAQELATLIELTGITNMPIFLTSPDSLYDPEYLFALFDELSEQGINGITFGIDAKVSSFIKAMDAYPDLVHRLKGKLHKIILGVESLHPETQNIVGKFTDPLDLIRVLHFCNEIDGLPMVQMIVGFPGDSNETLHESLNGLLFVRNSSPPFIVNVHRASPYPGTTMHMQAVAEGLIEADYLNLPTITAGEACMRTNYLTVDQVTRWVRIFVQSFYSDDYKTRMHTEKTHPLLVPLSGVGAKRALEGEKIR